MAIKRFQVALHNENTELPEDDVVNVLYFDVNGPDTVEGRCDDINVAYYNLRLYLNSALTGMTIKVYDMPGGGHPSFQKSYQVDPTGSGGDGPLEMACCLSYSADDGDYTTARRRGRLYLPVYAAGQRPGVSLQDAILDSGEELASSGVASNTTWVMWSTQDAVSHKIERIWVDDAWDTQRRRGVAPTSRQSRDVQ